MDKKEKEKCIFNMIFSDENITVLETEEPDFIVTNNESNHIFGVEITEFFTDECYARLQNIPHYFDSIIDNGKYFHKGDNKKLPVTNVNVIPRDMSESRYIDSIITSIPSRDEYAKKLIERIEDKNSKIHNYNKKAKDHYLIIFDNQNCINHKTSSDLYESIFNLELSKTIINSAFKEIFFITRVDSKLIFYRLKQVNFFALSNLSLGFAKSNGKDNEDAFALLITSLSNLGMELMGGFSIEENHIEIVNGIYSVILKEINDTLEISSTSNIFNATTDIDHIIVPFEDDCNYFKTIENNYIDFLNTTIATFNLSYNIPDNLDFIKK